MSKKFNDNCLFCKILNKKIDSLKIFENKYVYAFLDVFPADDGHTIIIPKKHFDNFKNTDDNYLLEMIKIQKLLSNNIYKNLNPKGMNYLINENEIAGQTVFHTHMHIIPKYDKNQGLSFVKKNLNNNEKTQLEDIQKKIMIN